MERQRKQKPDTPEQRGAVPGRSSFRGPAAQASPTFAAKLGESGFEGINHV